MTLGIIRKAIQNLTNYFDSYEALKDSPCYFGVLAMGCSTCAPNAGAYWNYNFITQTVTININRTYCTSLFQLCLPYKPYLDNIGHEISNPEAMCSSLKEYLGETSEYIKLNVVENGGFDEIPLEAIQNSWCLPAQTKTYELPPVTENLTDITWSTNFTWSESKEPPKRELVMIVGVAIALLVVLFGLVLLFVKRDHIRYYCTTTNRYRKLGFYTDEDEGMEDPAL